MLSFTIALAAIILPAVPAVISVPNAISTAIVLFSERFPPPVNPVPTVILVVLSAFASLKTFPCVASNILPAVPAIRSESAAMFTDNVLFSERSPPPVNPVPVSIVIALFAFVSPEVVTELST